MARVKKASRMGPDIPEISAALQPYKQAHPEARIRSYRQNSASLRVRIIDPDFRGMDRVDRHDAVWGHLESLPDDVISQITIVLLLTPEETKTSIANMDFEDPIPSRL